MEAVKVEPLLEGTNLNNLMNYIETAEVKVKNKAGLIKSLNKLNQVVGMDRIKESISKQTAYLISKQQQGQLSAKMLNTIITGNSGVGKSKISVILAEIWYHMGFLDYAVQKKEPPILSKILSYDQDLIKLYLFFGVIVLSQLYNQLLQPMYSKYGIQVIFILAAAILICGYLAYTMFEHHPAFNTDNDVITITSRSDFIGYYMGSTEKKTEELLMRNRGKVVFIDEAYSLWSGPQDMYGNEALTALNRFLSERPDEIVVIFAGYEDLMKETIFKVQPGLNRRCMWQFQCDPYNGEQLFQIFEQQLAKEQYQIARNDKYRIQDYIEQNVHEFKNHAGDTEKLAFFSQLNHSNSFKAGNYISFDDVAYGMGELMKNRLSDKSSKLDDLLKAFK